MDLSRATPIIVTEQPVASRAFYEGLLGMRVVMEEDGFLMFSSRSNPMAQVIVTWESPTAWDPLALSMDLSIDVGSAEQVNQAHAAAVDAGLEVLYPPTSEHFGRRRFVVREPSGAAVNVACHI